MSHELQVYKRSNFQNAFRWVAFAAIVALDIACIASTIQYMMVKGFSIMYFVRQIFGYVLLFVCNAAVLPSIVLEARKVEILDDRLVIHNLLYTTSIPWTDVRKVTSPIWLKFAIIRTPKWFALINKRDVEGFSDLIQIIRDKAEAAPAS
jgi:hypothetical protein